jgi:hypothetical protein
MSLLILWAVTTGCGTSAEPKADPDSLAAARNGAPQRKTVEEQAVEKKAAEEKAAEEEAAKKTAAEKKAAEGKAAANSYVKVKVEVELRGVLTCTNEAVTLSIVTPEFGTDRFQEVKWVLDFGEEKGIRAKAKTLDGKTVLVTGSSILRGVKSETIKRDRRGGFMAQAAPSVQDLTLETRSVLDVEPKVAVKSLAAATKE